MSRPFECDVCGTLCRTYRMPPGWNASKWVSPDYGFLHHCDDPCCAEQLGMSIDVFTQQAKEEELELEAMRKAGGKKRTFVRSIPPRPLATTDPRPQLKFA